MKTIFLIFLFSLLAFYPLTAEDMNMVFSDSIIPADSADVRFDTAFTEWRSIAEYNKIQFYSRLLAIPGFDDTNWVDDTFWINVQTSFNRVAVKTHLVDTFLDNSSSWSPYVLTATDSVFGPWIRGMVIHWDSIDVGDADSALVNRARSFKKNVQFWFAPKQ